MQYADKLFSVFQRLNRPHELKDSGIGLATVARIFNRHGGEIWTESRLHHGAGYFLRWIPAVMLRPALIPALNGTPKAGL